MKRIHPHLRPAIVLAAAICFVGDVGCRSGQSSGLPNPFLAPDHVPPPGTRTIAPGQAQPYYNGDPLPVMQSSAAAPNATVAATNPAAGAPNAPTGSLAWNAPGSSAQAPSATAPVAASATPLAQPTLAAANESKVSIPTDSDVLRFAAPAPMATTSPLATTAPATAPAVPSTIAPATQGVVPASYAAPVQTGPPSATIMQVGGTSAVAANPWRSPQVVPATNGAAATTIAVPNTIDVRLRAVPPPPPEPVVPTTPRIRLPGYDAPQSSTGVPTATVPYYAATTTPGALVQTVQIGPLPPPPLTTAGLPTTAGSTTSGDGFRPRSSMR